MPRPGRGFHPPEETLKRPVEPAQHGLLAEKRPHRQIRAQRPDLAQLRRLIAVADAGAASPPGVAAFLQRRVVHLPMRVHTRCQRDVLTRRRTHPKLVCPPHPTTERRMRNSAMTKRYKRPPTSKPRYVRLGAPTLGDGQSRPSLRGSLMDRWQYLIVLAACLLITAPLEMFGSRRLPAGVGAPQRAVLPVAAVFVVWDAVAIAAHVWTYNPQFVTGFELPARIPIEELLFFIVIPLCGLLTYNAVDTILTYVQQDPRPDRSSRHDGPRLHAARRAGGDRGVRVGIRRAAHRPVPQARLLDLDGDRVRLPDTRRRLADEAVARRSSSTTTATPAASGFRSTSPSRISCSASRW